MKKYVEDIKPGQKIRFASKQSIIGTEGSGSVAGYWTIWETRKTVNGWSQPYPVHLNFSDDDIGRYRGTLWNWEDENARKYVLRDENFIICPNCGEMRLSASSYYTLCQRCDHKKLG